MRDNQILAIAVFLLLIVLLLNEIAFQLTNVKIVVAIPSGADRVIEGEAREVFRDMPASD
jgi:hypothetical protein